MTTELIERLTDIVERRLGGERADWLRGAIEGLAAPWDEDAFLVAFSRAGRKLKQRADTPLEEADRGALAALAPAWVAPSWTASELGRWALLIAGLERVGADGRAALVARVFKTGDNREKRALLRVLEHLPEPEAYLDVAVESCRTNVKTVFEGIALDNPYPAARFPDGQFDQMVLKAIFIESPVGRIRGLAERVTSETVRMARGYASERAVAGRPVPEDCGLVERVYEGSGGES